MSLSKRSMLAAAFALVLAACATGQGEQKQTTGQYIDDATVTAKVKTAIASDVGMKAASNVNVETHQGTVQLSGFADTQDQASKAVAAAKKVNGVRSVKNDIRVK